MWLEKLRGGCLSVYNNNNNNKHIHKHAMLNRGARIPEYIFQYTLRLLNIQVCHTVGTISTKISVIITWY